ncbi:hypothetical protein WA158_004197 [Blastocystis sp. Blastoise]
MNKIPRTSYNEKSEPINWPLILCFALILGDICFVIGFVILFSENKRIQTMNLYNERVDNWNYHSRQLFRNAVIEARINGNSFQVDSYNDSFGDYYPQRDSCNYVGDPGCLSSLPLYYLTKYSIQNKSSFILNIYTKQGTIMNTNITTYEHFHRTKRDIGCEGASVETCISKCKENKGEWNDNISRCSITTYLQKLCYRIGYSKATSSFKLDLPPVYALNGETEGEGCEYNTKGSWSSKYFDTFYQPTINITFRYYEDPFVVASALTTGCSSNTENIHGYLCFGKTKEQQDLYAYICLVIGSLAVFTELICFFLVFCIYNNVKDKPSFLQLFTLSRLLPSESLSSLSPEQIGLSPRESPPVDDKSWLLQYNSDMEKLLGFPKTPEGEVIIGEEAIPAGEPQMISPSTTSFLPSDNLYDVYISGTDEGI